MVQILQMHEEKGNKIIRQHVYAIKEEEKPVIENNLHKQYNFLHNVVHFVIVILLSLHWQVEQKYHIQHHNPKQSECCSTDITSLGKQARACSSDIA